MDLKGGVENFAKDTPEGYTFFTNIGSSGVRRFLDFPTPDEHLAKIVEKYGEENVLVTSPAYFRDGEVYHEGRAVHVRRSAIIEDLKLKEVK